MLGTQRILDAFADFMNLFEYTVFSFVYQVMVCNLIAVQNLISSLKPQGIGDIRVFICIVSVLLSMIIVMLTLCLMAQALTSKLNKLRKLCINFMASLEDVILNDYSWKYGKTSYLYYLITAVFLVDLITYICNMIQVCVFCFKIVIMSLITFEFVLTGVQNNLLKLAEIITVVMFSVINYLVALVLSVRYELFFREVKRTKRLSISMLRQYQEGPLREKAKRMLKMIEESPPSFSVYDMWYMDASIFLKMINLVTSLIVTLLQFAFL
ncbi:hypothetical protein O3G_MSEX006749 [Manduca sexta]|nr:hypothetical protein O3G_MSEX006749 [Manduca sexta]